MFCDNKEEADGGRGTVLTGSEVIVSIPGGTIDDEGSLGGTEILVTGGHQLGKVGLSLTGVEVKEVKGKAVSTKCTWRDTKMREDEGSRQRKSL